MADEPTQDELHDEQGATVLPLREMMSTISADPVDPMYSTIVPTDGPAVPGEPVAEQRPGDTLPVEPPTAS